MHLKFGKGTVAQYALLDDSYPYYKSDCSLFNIAASHTEIKSFQCQLQRIIKSIKQKEI